MPDYNRILHLVSPDGNWEPFARVSAIAASMREQGYGSALAAPDHSRLWELAEAVGVEVVDYTLGRSINPLRWRDLAAMIQKTGAGIVHAHDGESAVQLGRAKMFLKDIAVVTSRYDLRDQPGSAEYGGGVDMVISPSQAMADAIKNRGASPGKVRVVYDGASQAMADRSNGERDIIRAGYRDQYCPQKEKPLFLVNISPLDEDGGQADILDVMPEILAALPQAHLFLMGEGGSRAVLERQINITAIEREVTILEPDKAFHRLLAGADLYIASGREDVSGFMVQAAMMAGRGVAARRSGCYPELLEDGKSGVFAGGDSSEDLKAAIMDLLQSRSRREQFGKQANARAVRKFNLSDMAAQMAEIYREAVAKIQ